MAHEPFVIPTTPLVVPMKVTVIVSRGAPACDRGALVSGEHPVATVMIRIRKSITILIVDGSGAGRRWSAIRDHWRSKCKLQRESHIRFTKVLAGVFVCILKSKKTRNTGPHLRVSASAEHQLNPTVETQQKEGRIGWPPVMALKPNTSRLQFTFNQLHGRMALKKPAVERCDWTKLKLLEGVTKDKANSIGVAGQVELYIPILPNAWRATSTGSGTDDGRLAEKASERINRVAKSDSAKLAGAKKLSHRNTCCWSD